MRLTDEQQNAVTRVAPRLAVTASAGAGKTSVLTARYIREVLENGRTPDQILAITFTRKAAAEMKLRITAALAEAGRPEMVQIAETGPIQTIHSFCERILRENALAAGLDPAFKVLESSQKERWAEDAVRQAIVRSIQHSTHVVSLIERVAGREEHRDRGRAHSHLVGAISGLMSSLRGSGLDRQELSRTYRTPHKVIDLWRTAAMATCDAEVVSAYRETDPDATFVDRIVAAHKIAKRALPPELFRLPKMDERRDAEDTCACMGIVLDAWEDFESRMLQAMAVDYNVLEERAVILLESNDHVAARVRDQYAVVLIDEAQDLNPMQNRLLEALAPSHLTLVGDDQQSIYGFRLADVELFRNHTERSDHLVLPHNHRSAPTILQFVNDVFGTKWPERYQPMQSRDDHVSTSAPGVVEIWPTSGAEPGSVAQRIRALVEEGVRPSKIAVLLRHARSFSPLAAALQVEGLDVRQVGGATRFYQNLEVRDLANALEAVADPYHDFALLCLLRSPLVGLSLDAIVTLGASPPVYDRLATFEPELDADRAELELFLRWFPPLAAIGDRLAAWEVLARLAADTPLYERLARRPGGAKSIANSRKLLRLAAAEPQLSPWQYARQLRAIQSLRVEEGDEPTVDAEVEAVTLITIHRSKGLEFPVVVLPDLHGIKAMARRPVEIDVRQGLVATSFKPPRTASQSVCWANQWLSNRRKHREREEEWRVVYVAMTRAERRLCLCLPDSAPSTALISELSALIGYPNELPDYVRVRQPEL
ncbi:MAG: UvrD-helicase domain-containing protein [Fimbriimonadaceae bacterium]